MSGVQFRSGLKACCFSTRSAPTTAGLPSAPKIIGKGFIGRPHFQRSGWTPLQNAGTPLQNR